MNTRTTVGIIDLFSENSSCLTETLVKAVVTLGDPRNNKATPTHVGNSTKSGVSEFISLSTRGT